VRWVVVVLVDDLVLVVEVVKLDEVEVEVVVLQIPMAPSHEHNITSTNNPRAPCATGAERVGC
jgi:hypothetical protein